MIVVLNQKYAAYDTYRGYATYVEEDYELRKTIGPIDNYVMTDFLQGVEAAVEGENGTPLWLIVYKKEYATKYVLKMKLWSAPNDAPPLPLGTTAGIQSAITAFLIAYGTKILLGVAILFGLFLISTITQDIKAIVLGLGPIGGNLLGVAIAGGIFLYALKYAEVI